MVVDEVGSMIVGELARILRRRAENGGRMYYDSVRYCVSCPVPFALCSPLYRPPAVGLPLARILNRNPVYIGNRK